MFDKQIPLDKLRDYVALLQICNAAPILARFPISDIQHVCESAVVLNPGYNPAPILDALREATVNHETYGDEVDHIANAGHHCRKCPARVICKTRQDWLTDQFNTTDTQ